MLCLVRNPREIEIVAALFALVAAIAAEQYSEKWWIVTTPSGNREFYHGPASYIPLLVIFIGVATVTYKVIVRVFSR
jgi:hypothetical protein